MNKVRDGILRIECRIKLGIGLFMYVEYMNKVRARVRLFRKA